MNGTMTIAVARELENNSRLLTKGENHKCTVKFVYKPNPE